MAGFSAIEMDKYSLVEDFNVDVEVEDEECETFSLCFWVYLLNSTTFQSTIIRQVHSDMNLIVPFLVLDENKKMLLPLTLLHKEAPHPVDTSSWSEILCVPTNLCFLSENGFMCVPRDYMRLVIDGVIEGVQCLTSLVTKNTNPECSRKIKLFTVGGDGYSFQGFIKSAEVLSASDHVEHHYMEDPPLFLSVDMSSSLGIKLDDNGVWKAPCKGTFSLDVVLSNAIGQELISQLLIDR